MKQEQEQMNRRQFLKRAGRVTLGTAFITAGLASAVEEWDSEKGLDDLDMYDFLMPRVKFAHESKEVDRWNVRPGGDANLLRELITH